MHGSCGLRACVMCTLRACVVFELRASLMGVLAQCGAHAAEAPHGRACLDEARVCCMRCVHPPCQRWLGGAMTRAVA